MRVRKVGEDAWKRDDGFRRVRSVLERVCRHEESPVEARRPDSIPDALRGWKREGRINPSAISSRMLFRRMIVRLAATRPNRVPLT